MIEFCYVCTRPGAVAAGMVAAHLEKYPACGPCCDSAILFITGVSRARPIQQVMKAFRAWVDGRRSPDTWA